MVDGRVAEVGSGVRADGAESVDFSGLWLMPGVFDCHDHVAFSTVDMGEVLRTPVTRWALESARNARVTLEAGVTFVRDLCGADRGLRDGIAAGYVPGPMLQISVVLICQTGGHGDAYLGGAGLEATLTPDYPGRPPYLVDGQESMRHAVRATLRAGADWIKLATTGGLVSEHDQPLVAELTPDEIAVAVFEAGRKGKPVSAHAYGGDGLTNAIEAGVRSIEHGGFLTEEQAQLMAARGLLPRADARSDARLPPLGGGGRAHADAMPQDPRLRARPRRVRSDREGLRRPAGLGYRLHQPRSARQESRGAAADAPGRADRRGDAPDRDGGRSPALRPRRRLRTHRAGCVFDAIVLDEDPGDLSVFASPGAVTGVFKAGHAVVPHARLHEQARPVEEAAR